MDYIPCQERKFPLFLQPLVARISAGYSFWLKHLVERLGSENVRRLWTDAFAKYDLKFLDSIISSGWTEIKPEDSPEEMETPDVFGTYVGKGKQGMSVSDARSIVENTPPLPQITSTFPDLNVQRDTATYEALHLYAHGLALISETLIDRFGKQGELIAYDTLYAVRSDLGKRTGGTVEDYFRQSDEDLDKPGIYSAGLEIEKVSSSNNESVMRIKECEWARYFKERHPGVGYLVACSTDEAYIRGFNKSLRMQRTSTLMEGGKFCDFHFYVTEGIPDKS
ncbi:MAG: L-2-amino-thiazoline-4-carboxylic acid hydrolase [Candidatus Zixiibacteriota bacterium]|nr:MAG: L-2-amino-thiazoline-4-carboxylic acid hydrolase [candidate division Zixibacteria bacterium]